MDIALSSRFAGQNSPIRQLSPRNIPSNVSIGSGFNTTDGGGMFFDRPLETLDRITNLQTPSLNDATDPRGVPQLVIRLQPEYNPNESGHVTLSSNPKVPGTEPIPSYEEAIDQAILSDRFSSTPINSQREFCYSVIFYCTFVALVGLSATGLIFLMNKYGNDSGVG